MKRFSPSYNLSATIAGVFAMVFLAIFTGCGETAAMQELANQAQPKSSRQTRQTQQANSGQPGGQTANSRGQKIKEPKLESITLGAGCFWCTEAVFQRLKGVEKVTSGYCNGEWPDPTYDDICTGRSGHAEVCKVDYDPEVISLPEILEVFWKTHDPTTLNRQGGDKGTQYRSGIYFTTPGQQEIAEDLKHELNKSGAWGSEIVTEIVKAEKFYPAEGYHQDYFNGVAEAAQKGVRKGNYGYCVRIIVPKLQKFEKVFADKLKSNEDDAPAKSKDAKGEKVSDKEIEDAMEEPGSDDKGADPDQGR